MVDEDAQVVEEGPSPPPLSPPIFAPVLLLFDPLTTPLAELEEETACCGG